MSELGEYMTQSNEPTIEYKNAIIARFMGYKRVEVGYSGTEEETEWQRNNEEWMNKVGITMVGHYFVDVPNDEWIPYDDIHYHDSWDALMSVVEKIEQYAHVTVRVGICTIWRKFMAAKIYAKENNIPFEDVMPIAECNDKGFIGNVHTAVYQFITWYTNKLNKF